MNPQHFESDPAGRHLDPGTTTVETAGPPTTFNSPRPAVFWVGVPLDITFISENLED